MGERIVGEGRAIASIHGRIQLEPSLPAGGRVRLFYNRSGQIDVLADELIDPDGLFTLLYRPPVDFRPLRIEVLAPDVPDPLVSHSIEKIQEGDFLEIRPDAVHTLDPGDLSALLPSTTYWRDIYPLTPEQVQLSQDAMQLAYENYDDGSRGLEGVPVYYPWRYQVNPTTRLPLLVRRRLDSPPSVVDAREAVVSAVRTRNFTSALFGVDLSQDFDSHFQPQSPIRMAVENSSRSMEANTHFSWQQVYKADDGESYPVLGGGFRVHSKTNMAAVAVTNSYFPVQAAGLFPAPAVADHDLFAIALRALFYASEGKHTPFLDALKDLWLERKTPLLRRLISRASAFLFRRSSNAVLAEKQRVFFLLRQDDGKEKRYPLAILPHAGRYYLVARVRVKLADEEAWYLDIDVHQRTIVGAAWQLVASAPNYFVSSEDAKAGNPSGQFPNPALKLDKEPKPPLVKIPDTPEVERATFAVHSQLFYTHLIKNCGAAGSLSKHVDNKFCFQVVFDSTSSKFVYDPQTKPKEIHLQKDTTGDVGILTDGLPIFHPGWDPELIIHELAHAFFWLLNDDPWETPQTIAPFSRALHEGYAVYLARSLAAKQEGQENLPWASGVYREKNWQARWRLQRSSRIVGADLLRKPNNYPVRNFHFGQQNIDWEDYDIGMIWARALWDLRQLLDPVQTDYLAVQAYPFLHGAIVNLQTAAEALIEADARKDSPLNVAAAVEPIWSTRGLTSDVGVFSILSGPGGQLFAGSERGILLRDGNNWAVDPASSGDVKLAAIDSLAVMGNRLFAIATPPRSNRSDGVPVWNVGLFVRENGIWQASAVPDGITPLGVYAVAGTLLLTTSSGVFVQNNGGWQQIGNKSTQIGDLNHWVDGSGQGWLIAGLPQFIARVRFPLPANAQWDLFRMPEGGRPSALVVWQERQYIGTLEQGIWRFDGDVLVRTDFVPPESAVLALAASATRLIWSTPEEVGWRDGTNSVRVAPPCSAGIVVSLWVDANETLFAGTLAHGIWRLTLTQPAPFWTAEHLPAETMALGIPAQSEALVSYFHGLANPSAPIVDVADEITVKAIAQPGFPLQMRAPNANRQVTIEAGWVILFLRNHLDIPVQIVAHSDNTGRVIVERG